MQGYVVRLVAFDFVLRIVGTCVVSISFEVDIAEMHLSDRAADTSGFGVPTHVIANCKPTGHDDLDPGDGGALARTSRTVRLRKLPCSIHWID
jgi:hypothetical protein